MENNINLAIKGEGFFIVESLDKSERYYTRKGNFNLNEVGYLVTTSGKLLLDKTFMPLLWQGKEDTKRIVVAVFTNIEELIRVDNGMYLSNKEPKYNVDEKIVHLMLETNEIDISKAFFEMIEKQNEIVKKSKKIFIRK